jgi:hypothetical protein
MDFQGIVVGFTFVMPGLTGSLERSPALPFVPGYDETPVGGFSGVPEKWNDNAQIQYRQKSDVDRTAVHILIGDREPTDSLFNDCSHGILLHISNLGRVYFSFKYQIFTYVKRKKCSCFERRLFVFM